MNKINPFITLLFVAVFSFTSQSQIETIDFETISKHIDIDSSNANNIWVVTEPNKVILNAPHSGSKAILTDSGMAYPAKNTSSFTLGFNISGSSPSVTFRHKFDTEKNKDGGYIEFRTDGDTIWTLLHDTIQLNEHESFAPYYFGSMNLYSPSDTLFNGKSGFSGKQDNWKISSINFICMAVKKSFPFYLRFTFISDSTQNTHEGWLIDDIIIRTDGECTSIEENQQEVKLNIWPNPVKTKTKIILDNLNKQQYQFEIYNLEGKRVLLKHIEQSTFEINRSNMSSGIHFYRLIDNTGLPVATGKLIFN